MKLCLLALAVLSLALVGCSGGTISDSGAEGDAKEINNRIKEAGGEVPAAGTTDGS